MNQIKYYKTYIALMKTIMEGHINAAVASLELNTINNIARELDALNAETYIIRTIPVFADSDHTKATEVKEKRNWQSSSDLCPWQNSGC